LTVPFERQKRLPRRSSRLRTGNSGPEATHSVLHLANPLPEEPDAVVRHVRIRGGSGSETAQVYPIMCKLKLDSARIIAEIWRAKCRSEVSESGPRHDVERVAPGRFGAGCDGSRYLQSSAGPSDCTSTTSEDRWKRSADGSSGYAPTSTRTAGHSGTRTPRQSLSTRGRAIRSPGPMASRRDRGSWLTFGEGACRGARTLLPFEALILAPPPPRSPTHPSSSPGSMISSGTGTGTPSTGTGTMAVRHP